MQQAQVIMLELHYPLGERAQVVHPVLAMDEKACVLMDCGYPGSLPLLQRTLQKRGVALSDVTHLILTHHDLDSAGCAGELVQAYPHIQVLATPQQEPFLRREKPSLRMQQMQKVYRDAPQEAAALQVVEKLFDAVQPVAVSRLIKDGDTFERVPAGIPGARCRRCAGGAKRRAHPARRGADVGPAGGAAVGARACDAAAARRAVLPRRRHGWMH